MSRTAASFTSSGPAALGPLPSSAARPPCSGGRLPSSARRPFSSAPRPPSSQGPPGQPPLSSSLPAWLADLWTPLSSGGPQPSSSPPVWPADLWPRPSSSPPGGPGRKPDRIPLLRPVALAQSLPPPTPDPSSFLASSSPLSFQLLCPFLL